MSRMATNHQRIDRLLGYLGLFLIGLIGWTCDRLADVRAAARPLRAHSRHRVRQPRT
jgi:hypothetical protein